jgi:glutathione S-transferase
VLTESAAIVTYVSEAFPAPAGFFVPRDARERAVLNEWCYFIMTELDALSLYDIRRHQDLFDIYGKAPEAIAAARENFTDLTGALFGAARRDTEYLMPQGFSVADILLSTCLASAVARGIALCDYLAAYRDRITRRPAWRAAWAINYPARPPG